MGAGAASREVWHPAPGGLSCPGLPPEPALPLTEPASPNRTRRLRRPRALTAALLWLPLALGCAADQRDGDADLQVRWSFEPSPPVVGTSGIRLDVSDVDWSPRNGAKVVLTGLRDGIELVVDTAVGGGAGR